MTEQEKRMIEACGLNEDDFKPRNKLGEVEEVADMAYVNSELALALIEIMEE